ncbi:hypothetical protein [Streptomyces qinglanensis]|uniref:hypothetical protein n=1 Tax=Streptomyces qinglanensis TaxID=943816 RepID=UPI003D713A3F
MTRYTPSKAVKEAIRAVEEAQAQLQLARASLRSAVADDLKAQPEVTNKEASEVLPFAEETVRSIAREFDVPRKRKPTVRSIKPHKHTDEKPPA